MTKYVKYVDVMALTLSYIKKQDFKPKHCHQLLQQMPKIQKESLFIQQELKEETKQLF